MDSLEQKQLQDDIQNQSNESLGDSDLNTSDSIKSEENLIAQTVTNCVMWQGRLVCNPVVNQEQVKLV